MRNDWRVQLRETQLKSLNNDLCTVNIKAVRANSWALLLHQKPLFVGRVGRSDPPYASFLMFLESTMSGTNLKILDLH